MTRAGTITFHLVAPDPEFLYKLTLPFAYPVPPSTPDEHQRDDGRPGHGPVHAGGADDRRGARAGSQPSFPRLVAGGTARRVRGPDRVDVRGRAAGAGRGRGRWRRRRRVRGIGAPDRLEDLFVRFAAQVHTSPLPATYFVVLNTEAPPFDDVEVRRAMNLALDRERVVQIIGGRSSGAPHVPAAPAQFPGVRALLPVHDGPRTGRGEGRGPPRTSRRPKRLVRRSGTAGMRVVFEYDDVPSGILGGPPGGLPGRAARRARIPREREARPARRLL